MPGCIDLYGETDGSQIPLPIETKVCQMMRGLAIVLLSIVIIIASLCFIAFCLCAADVSVAAHLSAGERVSYAIGALVALGSIIGMVKLIRKLNNEIGL
jgi:hypothetical protein